LHNGKIETLIIELGNSGCSGNPGDFFNWVKAAFSGDVDPNEFNRIFQKMVQSGVLKEVNSTTGNFKARDVKKFSEIIEYTASSRYDHSPIQFARSKLESYLFFHNLDEDTVNFILIGATEGFENAVKYNAGDTFTVRYWIKGGEFHMEVTNRMKHVTVEENIKAGKFDSSTTLMRGMLVMDKVFDFMDLNFSEGHQLATLMIRKKL